MWLGRHEEALWRAAQAVGLDALDRMTNFRLVRANGYARRYDEAVRCERIAIELPPDSPYTCFCLPSSLMQLGPKDEAWNTVNLECLMTGYRWEKVSLDTSRLRWDTKSRLTA